MFDISFGELTIIFTLCLLVLGPEKLPKLAAQLGRLAGQAKAMARHFRSQLEQEVQHEQMLKELRESDEKLSKVMAEVTSRPVDALIAAAGTATPNETVAVNAATPSQTDATAAVVATGFVHPTVQTSGEEYDPDFDLDGSPAAKAMTSPVTHVDTQITTQAATQADTHSSDLTKKSAAE